MKHPKLHYDFEKIDGTGDFVNRARVNEQARQSSLNQERGENEYAVSLDKKQCMNCGGQQSYKEVCDRAKTCTVCGEGKFACWTGRTDSLGFTDRMSEYTKHVAKKKERLAVSLRKEVTARTEQETQMDRRYRNLLGKQQREKGLLDFVNRMHEDDARRREEHDVALKDALKLDAECTFNPSTRDTRGVHMLTQHKFAAVYQKCDVHKLNEVSMHELRRGIDDANLELSKCTKGGGMPLRKEEVEELLWTADRSGTGIVTKSDYQRAVLEKDFMVGGKKQGTGGKKCRVGFSVKLIAADHKKLATGTNSGTGGTNNVPESNPTAPSSKYWRVIYLPIEESIHEGTTVGDLKAIVCKHYRSGKGPVHKALSASALGGEAHQLDYGSLQSRARVHTVTEATIGISTGLGAEAGEVLHDSTLLGAVQADMGSDARIEGPIHEEAVRMLTLHLCFRDRT
jgi:hypothetical protein